jgi:hypothetical protein
MAIPKSNLPVFWLKKVMEPKFRERVVRTALQYREQASPPAKKRLTTTLINHVQVEGFRAANVPTAPLNKLLPPTAQQFQNVNALAGAVLLVWLEAERQLARQVYDYLTQAGFKVIDPSVLEAYFPARWPVSEAEKVWGDFSRRHAKYNTDDAALMICCLSGRLPIPDEELAEETQPDDEVLALPQLLQSVLHALAALPPDANDWDALPPFLESVQRRQEQREAALNELRQQHEARAALTAKRQQLAQQIETLGQDWQTELVFFQMTHALDWNADRCEPGTFDEVQRLLGDLQACLQQYRERQTRPFTTLQEKREYQSAQIRLEDQALELYTRLDRLFVVSEEPIAGAAPGEARPESISAASDASAIVHEPEISAAPLDRAPEPEELPVVAALPAEAVVEASPEPSVEVIAAEVAAIELAEEPQPVSVTVPLPEIAQEEQVIPADQTERTELVVEQATEPAPVVTKEYSPEEWTAFFWNLIGQGDMPGAYWTARSLTAQNISMPLPDWLLAAVQGAWWLPRERGALVEHLGQIAQAHEPDGDDIVEAAATAAALVPSILVPVMGLGSWLAPLKSAPEAFNQIVAAVQEFNGHGEPLSRTDLLAVHGEDHRAEMLIEISAEAKRWLDEAPNRRSSLKRANEVWLNWTSRQGALVKILQPVADGNLKAYKQVKSELEVWRRTTTANHVQMTDVELHGRKPRPIDGTLLARWVNQAEIALQIAEEWCDLVNQSSTPKERRAWHLKQVELLVHRVEQLSKPAAQELALTSDLPTALLSTLRWSLADLCAALNVECPQQGLPARVWQTYAANEVEATGLWPGLHFRLLIAPEVGLDDDGEPLPERLSQVAAALRQAIEQPRSFSAIATAQIERQDYRFLSSIVQQLSRAEAEELEQRAKEARANSLAILKERVTRERNTVEQAVVDGLIDDDTRSTFDAQFLAIEDGAKTNHFGPLYARVADIHQQLEEVRARRVAQQHDRWQKIQQRLMHVDAHVRQRIVSFMETVFRRMDTVVADERLARLEEILDSGQVPDLSEFELAPARDAYREFLGELRNWEADNQLIVFPEILRRIDNGQSLNWLLTRQLPKPRLLEISEAFQSWLQLKRAGTTLGQDVLADGIIKILSYMGFAFNTMGRQATHYKDGGRDWAHFSVSMSASSLSPIPQFGSQHAERFDVFCLWERPGPDVIGARLHNVKLQVNNVIVLYFGRLLSRQRIDVMRFTRDNGLALAIMDEFLLLYLAREYESRLPSFFKCALPLASINPYVGTGVVPPEMFFGRSEEKRSVQLAGGAALVYGGRQLGKSALLQQVEREFHNPDDDRYVLREDIKLIGDPAGGQEIDVIWRKLREGFERLGLVRKTTAEKADTVIEQIREMMAEHPSRRVLVLLDEADNFLAADAARSFEVVSLLKNLMDDTHRRFKVIFTGLHNVQRYEGIPNQPLAHLPRLLVGPLEPASARQLIRQPLEALGFRFPEDDDTPLLGILAYSNYHPGLIQIFCRELLRLLYKRRPSELNPYVIQRSDVEAVYRQSEVQSEIRLRFDWTLALDSRYQALAWSMVFDQMEERDGFAKTYTVDDLREMGKIFWPAAFQSSTREEFRGYLDEMVGLGVLVRNTEGAYRLRSPNLVRLMGKEKDIMGSLQELADKPVNRPLVADSHHAPLDDLAKEYSPLTYAQARLLNAQRFGVGLIFGSDLLCIDQVSSATRVQFMPPGSTGRWAEIRPATASGEMMTHWLEKYLDDNPKIHRLIAVRIMSGERNSMAKQVEAALKFCQRRQKHQEQWMRVLFVFDNLSTYEWLQLPLSVRVPLEKQADVVIALQRWNEIGIEQVLKQQGKMSSEPVVENVMNQVGGWPRLLDRLIVQWNADAKDDPLPAAQLLRTRLETVGDEERAEFIADMGLGVDPNLKRIFHSIMEQGESIPQDLFAPELLNESLTADEWLAITEYFERVGLILRQNNEIVVEPIVKQVLSIQ